MIDKANSLDSDTIMKSVMENDDVQAEMIKQNKFQMYNEGIDAEGDSLGEYSMATIHGGIDKYGKPFAGKIAKGQRFDHITLSDTFTFYNSIKVDVNTDNAVMEGNMQKDDTDLSKQWPDALGLTPDSITWVANEKVKPLLIDELKNRVLCR